MFFNGLVIRGHQSIWQSMYVPFTKSASRIKGSDSLGQGIAIQHPNTIPSFFMVPDDLPIERSGQLPSWLLAQAG